jgi:hypothetical protein
VLRAQGPAAAGPTAEALVRHMRGEDLKTALEYCREWNTNARNCHVAQAMLRALLSTRPPKDLLAVPGAQPTCMRRHASQQLPRNIQSLTTQPIIDHPTDQTNPRLPRAV